MMPIPMRRKRRAMEKVENLYRTARAQNVSINTSEQIRSRLRESRRTLSAGRSRTAKTLSRKPWLDPARAHDHNAITVAAGGGEGRFSLHDLPVSAARAGARSGGAAV